ncbi:DsbA family protein [Telmatospirillum siberiense]|nr:DsbA family protein [Telmatospirillum siberiense]
MTRTSTVILLLSAGVASTLTACNGLPKNDETAERQRLDGEIHDYLTSHPEILMEMSQALRQKQQTEAQEKAHAGIARNHAAIFDDASDPVGGNPAGQVTIVEFFDAECPFCKRVSPDLERLTRENNDVRIVFKEFPILGAGSVTAARAALASMKQGKYDAFHHALMADTTPEHQLAEPHIMDLARSSGLDVERLKQDMTAPDIEAKIAANKSLAQTLGITGTPGLIIGDRLTPGAMPYDAMVQAVAAARSSAADHR